MRVCAWSTPGVECACTFGRAIRPGHMGAGPNAGCPRGAFWKAGSRVLRHFSKPPPAPPPAAAFQKLELTGLEQRLAPNRLAPKHAKTLLEATSPRVPPAKQDGGCLTIRALGQGAEGQRQGQNHDADRLVLHGRSDRLLSAPGEAASQGESPAEPAILNPALFAEGGPESSL